MANFVPGQPVETTEPNVEVTITRENQLRAGVHRFQLVVVDDQNNESEPAFAEITVQDTRPRAVLRIIPNVVEIGRSFTLDGRSSTDTAPGRIVRYVWTLLPQQPPQ
jgi:hypothetical protein